MRAEYDRENNRVVALENDNGRVSPTHNPRVLGAETEWLPVEVIYPEGYDQRFNNLLSPHEVEYRYVDGRIEVHYPKADFSPKAIRRMVRESISISAKRMLSETDWYFVRQLDTGEPVPDAVREERQAVRDRVKVAEGRLEKAKDGELRDFEHYMEGDVPNRVQAKPAGPVKGGDGREWVTNASSPDEEGEAVHPVEDEPLDLTEQGTPVIQPEKPDTGLPWSLNREA